MAAHVWAVHNAGPAGAPGAPAAPAAAYAGVVLCWLLSAGIYIAAKWATADMPPWALAFWRPLLAALILLPLVLSHRRPMARLLRTRGVTVLLVGGIGLAISQGMIYTGLRDTSAVNAGLIMALMPMLTLFLAWAVLGETLRAWQVAGTLVALSGLVVIVTRGQLSTLSDFAFSRGDLWIAGSALAFALYGVLLRKARFDLPRLPLLVLLLGSGVIAALPFYAAELIRGEHATMNTSGLLALAYTAIPGGALMYYLYNRQRREFRRQQGGRVPVSADVLCGRPGMGVLGRATGGLRLRGGRADPGRCRAGDRPGRAGGGHGRPRALMSGRSKGLGA